MAPRPVILPQRPGAACRDGRCGPAGTGSRVGEPSTRAKDIGKRGTRAVKRANKVSGAPAAADDMTAGAALQGRG